MAAAAAEAAPRKKHLYFIIISVQQGISAFLNVQILLSHIKKKPQRTIGRLCRKSESFDLLKSSPVCEYENSDRKCKFDAIVWYEPSKKKTQGLFLKRSSP